ncbi:mannosyl-oligosaccharide 1,2-alpha-mannosidase [Kwoniella mangroviensis CBS 8886]|nr:mannosyl-oligosaccharide 1,2-alpha-mannosidase [Kwoniella mangroviensis CBS 8886]
MLSPKQNGKTMPYTPAYSQDVEKGLSSPTKIARRFVSRKPRWILGGLILFGVVFYFYESGNGGPHGDLVPPPPPHHHGPSSPHHEHGQGHDWSAGDDYEDDDYDIDDDDDDDDDHDEDEDEEGGKGWKNWLPFGGKPKRPPPNMGYEPTKTISTEVEYEFIVDNNGDHYIQDWVQPIAPLHPDLSLLRPPEELLPEINLKESSPPKEDVYPDDKLRMIISPTPPNEEIPRNVIPADAWSKMWMEERRPEDWKGHKGDMKKVQWSGFARGRDTWENGQQKKEREDRRDAVKRGFKHAWEAYKRHAWGHDEVRPVSQTPSNPFNGWGATIIDSLDTLLLMGFSDEYNLCRAHINQVNFHWVNGRDWSSGYITEDEEGTGEVYALPRDKGVGLPVFETGIRYLGGLLGAYDLSGDKLLVERAEDLANVLGKAFDTVSGLPAGRIDPGLPEGEMIHLSTVSIAEVGSMSLELIRLSQVTNDRKWFDLAQRAMEYLEERVIPRSTQTPLIPMWFQPDTALEHIQSGGFTFGGLADSYYEYLIKTYKLLGNNEHAQTWKKVYEESIDKAKEVLYKDIEVVPDRELFTIGKFENGRLIHELEHLTCFAGAMLGLGAKLLHGRKGDMVDAEKLTKTCYWLSADTPTGLQPEVMEWYQPHDEAVMYENITIDNLESYKPPISSEDIEDAINNGGTIAGTHKDMSGLLRWNLDGTPVQPRNPATDPVKYAKKLKGRPTGARKVVGRGINRPETIESIFYMYRLTGDRQWQEKGWKMFVSWMQTAKVDGGISSVDDVTKQRGQLRFGDNMESFALAETFKYHFLLQSEPDVLSLDDYVLNTEAHPFLVNPILDPTSSTSHVRYWTPSPDQDLGVRGQGTNVQKFARLNVIDRIRGPAKGPPIVQHFGQGGPPRPVGGGGGKGMGGGGGRPGDRPKPPPGFGMKKIKVDVGEDGGAKFPDDF